MGRSWDRVLTVGDKGTEVQLIQYVLQLIGYNPGIIDGIFGAKTEAAIKEFEQDHGLIAGGLVGPETRSALLPYILGFREYNVQIGDTLATIADKFSTSVEAVKTANPHVNPMNLRVGQKLIIPYSFDVVKTNVPYTYKILQYDLSGLKARYPFLDINSIGHSVMGKELYVLRLGTGKNKVTYNSAHHANEWITTPVLMKWIEEFLKAYVSKGEIRNHNIEQIWNYSTIDIVPMVNPDGVDLVIEGAQSAEDRAEQLIQWNYGNDDFSDWKANINGVDLNRNYNAGWERYKAMEEDFGITGPAPSLYAGKQPVNQPEVMSMVNFTKGSDFQLALAYHTQGEVIFWDFMGKQPPESHSIGEEFAKVSGYILAEPSPLQGYAGYKDWFIEEFGRPGYTIECGKGKNPLPLDQFSTIYDDNEELLLLASIITSDIL